MSDFYGDSKFLLLKIFADEILTKTLGKIVSENIASYIFEKKMFIEIGSVLFSLTLYEKKCLISNMGSARECVIFEP